MLKKLFRRITRYREQQNHPAQVGGIFERMSPEGVCGINPSMDREEIRGHLARLYKRYNSAAGSLDPELRHEAEMMLDCIVRCREKYIEKVF
jgi:hypothetical protein